MMSKTTVRPFEPIIAIALRCQQTFTEMSQRSDHIFSRDEQMDLNYLLQRQQIERSKAELAASGEAREVHLKMAELYEREIEKLTPPAFHFPSTDRES